MKKFPGSCVLTDDEIKTLNSQYFKVMLHELLLALAGPHGQIFTLQKDPKRFKVSFYVIDKNFAGKIQSFESILICFFFLNECQVTGSLNLVHPAEAHILGELLSVGCGYHSLQQFIQRHRDAANRRRDHETQDQGSRKIVPSEIRRFFYFILLLRYRRRLSIRRPLRGVLV